MSAKEAKINCEINGTKFDIEIKPDSDRSVRDEKLKMLSNLMEQINNVFLETRGDQDEPLLQDLDNKYDYFTFEHRDIEEYSKDMELSLWTAGEVDISSDFKNRSLLTKDGIYFIENTLAFFFSSDGIVFVNAEENFGSEMKWPEVKRFFAFQAANELSHSEAYGIQLDAWVKDEKRRLELRNGIVNIPTIAKKAQWAQKWMTREKPLAERILAFICIEGIFFSSSFASIYWLKSAYPGSFEGITNYNHMIARDEATHTRFGCHLYSKYIKYKCTPERIFEIFKEAFEIECDFTTSALPCSLLGINSSSMIEHIKSVVNELLSRINSQPMFPDIKKSPFPFMNLIALDPKKNIFETRVTEYQRVQGRNISDENSDDDIRIVDF